MEAITVSSHQSSRRSSSATRSSMSAARLTLRLQQLESERQTRLQELEDAEKFQRLRRQIEADFEKQKLETLEAQLLAEEENRSVRSRVSSRIVRENTSKWIGTTRQSVGPEATLATVSVSNPVPDDDQTRDQGEFQLQASESGVKPDKSTQPTGVSTGIPSAEDRAVPHRVVVQPEDLQSHSSVQHNPAVFETTCNVVIQNENPSRPVSTVASKLLGATSSSQPRCAVAYADVGLEATQTVPSTESGPAAASMTRCSSGASNIVDARALELSTAQKHVGNQNLFKPAHQNHG
nr:uncharacterized protein LOC115261619 [Aedes albopictus]